MKWISVKERLPELDEYVLIYWQLKKGKKEEDGFYDMVEIASLDSITHRKDQVSTDWKDKEYNGKEPTHWMLLPEPPKQD